MKYTEADATVRSRSWLLALALLLAWSSWTWSQEPPAELLAASDLREAIERAELGSDYRAMILAAVELREAATSPEDRIFAQRTLGRGYALLGDFERAVEALSAAVSQVQPGMPPRLLAEMYRDASGMLGELGRYEQSLSLVERGLDVLADTDNADLEAELLVIRASVLGALGRLDEAMVSIDEAMDRPLTFPRQQIMRRNNRGMIHKWRGELDAALPEFQAVYEQAQAEGIEQLVVYGLLELGDVERQLGALDPARRHLEEALRRSEAAGEDRWSLFAHTYLAELATAEGDDGRAELHREAVERIQTNMQDDAMANRARVLEISLEVLEREKEVQQLQMEGALQQARLDRGRTMMLLGTAVAGLLLVALWLAIQKSRVRASANRELDRLANTDELTGLHNRRFFVDHMRRRMAEGDTRGALILIDVDQFKRVNDDHGHDHGDAVLKAVADRIQAMMRAEDVLARWGGEEFLAFLPNCDEQAARRVAERIRSAIDDPPVEHNGVERPITATLGVAALASGQDLDEAFRRADAALYRGKSEGRNCVRYADEAAPA